MNREQIDKLEKIIEKQLFEETNPTDYALKKADVIIKYLIYYNLKEIWLELLDMDDDLLIIHNELKAVKEKLASIDETLFDMTNSGIYKNKDG